MTPQNLSLSMKLLLDTQQFVSNLTKSGGHISSWSRLARSEVSKLYGSFNTVQGKLAGIGAGIGVAALVKESAQLDKNLTQIGLTAGAGAGEIVQLRNEIFRLARDTGQPVTDLNQGVNNLVQSGLKLAEALPVIGATSKAMAVAKANADSLTGGLAVASAAFDFDLSQPTMALGLLDKMVVAGRLGNAELENLSSIFARVGVNSRAAGFGFDSTLGFIEGLSMIERQPERLATLADSTLRLFTNARYRQAAQSATGVKFFDANGAARNPLQVLDNLRTKFKALKTDMQRERFISKAFGATDLDTQRGLRTLLTGDALDKVNEFSKQIGNAAGTLDRDLNRAIDNSVDQVGRLKAALTQSADSFTSVINRGISAAIGKLMDSKEKGGFALSGGEMIGGVGALAVGGYAARRFLPGVLGKLTGSAGNLAGGIAMGKAVEAAGGAAPVFVVNMPSGGIGGGIIPAIGAGALAGNATKVFGGLRAAVGLLLGAGSMSAIGSMGATGIAGASSMVGGAGLIGYGTGTLINKYALTGPGLGGDIGNVIGTALANLMALLGNENAKEAVSLQKKHDMMLRIELDDKRARITKMDTGGSDMEITAEQMGRIMTGGY